MNDVVLDTNVVWEPRRPRLDSKVLAWLADQAPKNLFLTATVVGELGVGMTTLPGGRRRSSIEAWLADLLEKQFAGRVLPTMLRRPSHLPNCSLRRGLGDETLSSAT